MFEEDREIEKSSQKKRILVGNSESLKKFRTMKGEKRRSKNEAEKTCIECAEFKIS